MRKFTVAAYYAGIPPNNSNPEKPLILDNYCLGVMMHGDRPIKHLQPTLVMSDVAILQGFVHENSKTSPHLVLRKKILDFQKENSKKTLIVDSNLFLYADPGNTKTYLRYSYDGVFPSTGFYFDKHIDPSRWSRIKQNLGLSLKDYRKNGSHVLICLQRNGGWSMQGLNSLEWLNSTINIVKKFTDRPIIVRAHPGDKTTKQSLKINLPNVSISKQPSLIEDLKNAWATIVYNSSPSIASLIEGIPVFLTDPKPENSQSFEVGNTNLSKIETPDLFDRQKWIEKISMCHWNFDELKSGEAWRFMKDYVDQ